MNGAAFPSDVAFTPAVKAIQARRGSRRAYARMEEGPGWQATVTPELAQFIAAQTSVFLGTASAAGQPYIQHRGGPPGFIQVLDERTLAFAELRGNRQYITQGNLAENPRAHLFLIDYAQQRRIKIWGLARIVEDDPVLISRLTPSGMGVRGEAVLRFDITAWDENCARHIPRRIDAVDVEQALAERDQRIAALEAEVRRLGVCIP